MNRKKLLFYTALLAFCYFLDRFSKLWALYVLQEQRKIEIFSFFNLSLEWNAGISWSLFSPQSLLGFFILTSVIIIVLLIFLMYVFDEYKHRRDITYEILVVAGALSNLTDRLYYGAVIDFCEVHFKTCYWPVFNVADIFVVVGVLGILMKSSELWSKK